MVMVMIVVVVILLEKIIDINGSCSIIISCCYLLPLSLLRLIYLFLLTNDDGRKPYTIDITTNAIITCNLNMILLLLLNIFMMLNYMMLLL